MDFPAAGQRTNDHEQFRDSGAGTPVEQLHYLGVLLHGPARTVRSLTGGLALLR